MTPDIELSSELQELYLENKQWLSEIHFLEDETRFFRKLFGRSRLVVNSKLNAEAANLLENKLAHLESHRDDLKNLVTRQQKLVEKLLINPENTIELSLIEDNATIVKEIKELFNLDKAIKIEVYQLADSATNQ